MNKNFKKTNSVKNRIELEIDSIFKHLSSTTSSDRIILREKPKKYGATAKEIIKICDPHDTKHPQVTYVFYPSTCFPGSLGSIAIYCDNASIRHLLIIKNRSIFGFPVRRATLEMGLRPFVDVRIRP